MNKPLTETHPTLFTQLNELNKLPDVEVFVIIQQTTIDIKEHERRIDDAYQLGFQVGLSKRKEE